MKELPVSFYEPDWANRPKKSIWAVVGGWLKEESFYRDIATRTLSILVAAVAAYLYAVATGYISTPPGRTVLPVVLLSIYLIVFTPLVFRLVFRGKTSSSWVSIPLAVLSTTAMSILYLAPTDDPQWRMVRAISVDVFSYSVIALALVLGFGMVRDLRRANAATKESPPD
ncbi:hypothetical protein [Mycolicibacterium sp. A43C]